MQEICSCTRLNKYSLDDRTAKIFQEVTSQREKCIEDFSSRKCSCSECWIREYYGLSRTDGLQKTLFNEVVVNACPVEYYDENCDRGVLGKFVPESYPVNTDFLMFKFDFSKKNPRIFQRFIPSVSGQDKTYFWRTLNLSRFLVSVPFSESKCVGSIADAGGEFIIHGVLKDSREVRTSDALFIEKVLSLKKRPFAILPVERSLYMKEPHFISVYRLFKYLNSFKYYWLSEQNVIPFIIGSTEEQMKLCCTVLRSWGFKNVAWSLSGLNKAHASNRIRKLYGLISSYFDQVVMVNFLSFRGYFYKSVFVSPDWYLIPHAFGKRIKTKGFHQDRSSPCPFCKDQPEEMVSKEELALCSLSRIFSFFGHDKQTTLEEFLCQRG